MRISIPAGFIYGADFPANPLVKPGWTIDHNDEFDGPSLDTDVWLPYYLPHMTTREKSAPDYVFRDWQNSDVQNNTLVTFKRHCKWAGIVAEDKLTIHTMRKCACTHWANINRNPKVTQVLAGHADLKTTMEYYVGTMDDQKQDAATAIEALLDVQIDV